MGQFVLVDSSKSINRYEVASLVAFQIRPVASAYEINMLHQFESPPTVWFERSINWIGGCCALRHFGEHDWEFPARWNSYDTPLPDQHD